MKAPHEHWVDCPFKHMLPPFVEMRIGDGVDGDKCITFGIRGHDAGIDFAYRSWVPENGLAPPHLERNIASVVKSLSRHMSDFKLEAINVG